MSFEVLLLLIICIPTLIVFLIHKITYKYDNKFSNFINRIWCEWFEDQSNAIVSVLYFLFIMIIAVLLLESCNKRSNEIRCDDVLESLENTDYYHSRCKDVSDKEEEIDKCIDDLRFTSKEIKEYCDTYYEEYDYYKEE